MFRLIVVWILNALALLVLPYVVPSIHVDNFRSALVAALVLAFINTLIRPLFVLLTLPVTLLTLGLFLLVINGLLFWFVGSFVRGFVVEGFWTGVLGAIVYSIISWALASLILPRRTPVRDNS
ncbi:MAG TPA: phage holin family protein [Casimicrobiaceae bacterium]|nr:phage holin family protein [Casimicrobiaceae bacterium]